MHHKFMLYVIFYSLPNQARSVGVKYHVLSSYVQTSLSTLLAIPKSSLIEAMRDWFTNGTSTDVTIETESGTIRAHKIVLVKGIVLGGVTPICLTSSFVARSFEVDSMPPNLR